MALQQVRVGRLSRAARKNTDNLTQAVSSALVSHLVVVLSSSVLRFWVFARLYLSAGEQGTLASPLMSLTPSVGRCRGRPGGDQPTDLTVFPSGLSGVSTSLWNPVTE